MANFWTQVAEAWQALKEHHELGRKATTEDTGLAELMAFQDSAEEDLHALRDLRRSVVSQPERVVLMAIDVWYRLACLDLEEPTEANDEQVRIAAEIGDSLLEVLTPCAGT